MKHRNLKTAISSVLISLAIYIIASFMIVMLIYEGMFARVEEYEHHSFLCYEDMEGYVQRDITFQSDGYNISGKIYGENTDKLVILAHSKGGSGEDMLAEACFFADNGYSAMVFDFVGCGKSDGSSQLGLQRPVYELESAVEFAKEQGFTDIYLHGIGVGGYAAAACADIEGIKAVSAASSFSSVADITLEYATENMGVFGYLEYPIMWLYQYLVFGSELNNNAVSGINSSDVPIIIINGTADETIHHDGAALINSADEITNRRTEYISIENGRHSSILRSENARALLEKFNGEAYELYNSYSGSVPEGEIKALYEKYDRAEMSELDAELMDKILTLFNSAE